MDQHQFIDRVTAALTPDPRIRALFLSGSFGRGTADAWSDVDFLALVPRDHQEELASEWRSLIETFAPIVHFTRLPHALVLNAITADWPRCDLSILAPDQTAGLTQDRYKPLIDRDDIFPTLTPALAAKPIDGRRVEGLTNEFIRILGLTPVALGRNEVELAAGPGTSFLRRFLMDLLTLEMQLPDTGGMLHLSRVIDQERMDLLASIPLPDWSLDSAIRSQLALARAFMPRAKAIYAQLGLEWPEAFEAATRAHLARHLPAPFPPDW